MTTPHPLNTIWHLGAVGFGEDDWASTFYPRSLHPSRRLSFYAANFHSIEIDTTFHAIPAPATVTKWAAAVPSDFRFCIKASADITHGPRLPGGRRPDITPPDHLASPATQQTSHHFFRILAELGDKLDVVIFQFPATFDVLRRDELANYLASLPAGIRYAVEFRNPTWWEPPTAHLLRALNISWVATDLVSAERAARAPFPDDLDRPDPIVPTADFLYCRLIGPHNQFPNARQEHLDPSARLAWWNQRLRSILEKRPEIRSIHTMFGNGFAGHAPATARRFASIAGLTLPTPPPDSPLSDRSLLFSDHSNESRST